MTRLSLILLAAMVTSGCVSTRRYNRDMKIINENFKYQLDFNRAATNGFEAIADYIKRKP